ncbi:MAG: DUF6728 family protein [Cytophagales bacterium]
MKTKEYFQLGEVFGYFFRKNDPNRVSNFSLKSMHFVNKLSMAIFLVCLVVMAFRFIKRM